MGDWRGRLAGRGQRIAAAPLAPAVAGALLGVLAVAETLARGAGTAAAPGPTRLALVLAALATTVPLGLLWARPALAAPAVTAAAVVSLAAFHTLTVAGLVAQLAALYRLGRHGSAALAAAVAMPYLVVALAHPQHGVAGVFLVLLASLAPVAAWAGIARRARSEAVAHSAARQVIAGSLLEHTARGERARISRELHDVVAHHISMIAVQAESARLTTPGMPAAGAQRLSAIGDTARSALTEMRRLLGVLREDAARRCRRPAAPARPAAARRTARRGQGRLRSGRAPHRPRLAARPRPGRGAGHVPHRPGGPHQRAAARAGSRGGRGAALHRRCSGRADPRQRARPAAGRAAGGHGLAGMRERAVAVGGELHTAEASGGGFLVAARLPAKAEELAG